MIGASPALSVNYCFLMPLLKYYCFLQSEDTTYSLKTQRGKADPASCWEKVSLAVADIFKSPEITLIYLKCGSLDSSEFFGLCTSIFSSSYSLYSVFIGKYLHIYQHSSVRVQQDCICYWFVYNFNRIFF